MFEKLGKDFTRRHHVWQRKYGLKFADAADCRRRRERKTLAFLGFFFDRVWYRKKNGAGYQAKAAKHFVHGNFFGPSKNSNKIWCNWKTARNSNNSSSRTKNRHFMLGVYALGFCKARTQLFSKRALRFSALWKTSAWFEMF